MPPTYAEHTAQRYCRPGDPPRWLADHLPDLEADPYRRGDNGALAICLLQPFLDGTPPSTSGRGC